MELPQPLCCPTPTFMSPTCSRPPLSSPIGSPPGRIPQELGCRLPPALPQLCCGTTREVPTHHTTSSREWIYSDSLLLNILYPSPVCLSAAISSARAAFPACFTFRMYT